MSAKEKPFKNTSIFIKKRLLKPKTLVNKAVDEMSTRIRKLTFKNVNSCTFHSLGTKILRENISNLGYESTFIIYDEEDSLKLLNDCLNTQKTRLLF